MNDKNEILDTAYREHRKSLHALARSILRDDAAAEDAVQDAMLRAFKSWDSYDQSRPILGWLHTIVVNRCKLAFVQRKKLRSHEITASTVAANDSDDFFESVLAGQDETPVDIMIGRSAEQAYGNSLRRITQDHPVAWSVYAMNAMRGVSLKQTAQFHEIPPLNARRFVTFVRARLARDLAACQNG